MAAEARDRHLGRRPGALFIPADKFHNFILRPMSAPLYARIGPYAAIRSVSIWCPYFAKTAETEEMAGEASVETACKLAFSRDRKEGRLVGDVGFEPTTPCL